MFGISPLVPAYGRDYTSMKAVQADFNADKDFQTAGGQYINRLQVKELGMRTIQVRYGKLRKIGMLKVS